MHSEIQTALCRDIQSEFSILTRRQTQTIISFIKQTEKYFDCQMQEGNIPY